MQRLAGHPDSGLEYGKRNGIHRCILTEVIVLAAKTHAIAAVGREGGCRSHGAVSKARPALVAHALNIRWDVGGCT